MVRLGIVGVGSMGSVHAKNVQAGKIPNCTLTAICDIEPSQMDPYENVKKFSDSAALIRSGEVDAVLVATPHYDHTTIGIDALEQGLHLLSEKPISVHKADCERLIAAHEAHPEQVFCAMFMTRTTPIWKKMKAIIDSGELGELRRVNWIISDWFRTEAYYASGGWRATWKGEGGGVLLNQCPHNLDLLWWLCGMPTKMWAQCNIGKYHNIEVEDEVNAVFEYANGATGMFMTTTGESPGTNRLEIIGDMGKAVLEKRTITLTKNEVSMKEFRENSEERFATPGRNTDTITIEEPGGQHNEIIENFCNAIEKGETLIAPAEQGIYSVELANAMLYSSFVGQQINLPLDGAQYEAKLKELIANSTHTKEVRDVKDDDFANSFNN